MRKSVGVNLGLPAAACVEWLLQHLRDTTTTVCAGIDDVRRSLQDREKDAQMVLHALAGVLAGKPTPLLLEKRIVFDFAQIQPVTLAVLAKTLKEVRLECDSFQPQHWESLRSLQCAVLSLRQTALPPAQQPPFSIQSMQLTRLTYLQFFDSSRRCAICHASTRLSWAVARR